MRPSEKVDVRPAKARRKIGLALALVVIVIVSIAVAGMSSRQGLSTSRPTTDEGSLAVCAISSFFNHSAVAYDDDLALEAATLCEASESDDDAGILDAFESCGLSGCETFNYGGSNAFAVAFGKLADDNDADSLLLVVVARGTQPSQIGELAGDFFKGPARPFLEASIWDNVFQFEEDIWSRLRDGYLPLHPEIASARNLKVLLAGHSLGGSAACAAGARLTSEGGFGDSGGAIVMQDDVYVYTFGAIKTLVGETNLENGFENIHNIYNAYDSFGPEGNWGWARVSSPHAKFGHTDMYRAESLHDSEDLLSTNNHNMANYRAAILGGYVGCQIASEKEETSERRAGAS